MKLLKGGVGNWVTCVLEFAVCKYWDFYFLVPLTKLLVLEKYEGKGIAPFWYKLWFWNVKILNLNFFCGFLVELLWTRDRGCNWRDFIFDSVALSQALEGDSPDQLMQQTQNLQYAYAPNMGQPWVLTRPSFLPVSISCSAANESPISPTSFPFSPSFFPLFLQV